MIRVSQPFSKAIRIVVIIAVFAFCTVIAGAARRIEPQGSTRQEQTDLGGNISSFPTREGIDVVSYGAKCDGSSDDTTAVQNAIRAAGSGGMLVFPSRRRCRVARLSIVNITGLTLSGAAAKEPSQSSPASTGIEFTGSPSWCSSGSGGLLRVANSYNILIEGLGLYETAAGLPADCFINVSNGARIRFVRDHIGDPLTGVNTAALSLENLAQIDVIQTTIDEGFGQSIVEPAVPGNYVNLLRLIGDRFGQQPLPFAYNYQVDLAAPTARGSFGAQAVNISDDAFEVGPNNLRIVSGVGVKIATNWVGDGMGMAKWTGGTAVRASCVTATNYGAYPYVFCTSGAGRTGSREPVWSRAPGSRTPDGSISWINDGPGVSFNLAINGEVMANVLVNPSAGNMTLNPQGASGPVVSGNSFSHALWWNLRNLATGTSVVSNNFVADPAFPALSGLLVVGDGVTNVASVDVRANHYTNTSRNRTPFVRLNPNSHGVIDFDASRWGAEKLTNSGSWHSMNAGAQPNTYGANP